MNNKQIEKWCKEHPNDEVSKMFLEGFARRREELKRWRMIGEALALIGEQGGKQGRTPPHTHHHHHQQQQHEDNPV